MVREINDVYDLRAAYYEKHPNGHFLTRTHSSFSGSGSPRCDCLRERSKSPTP